MKTGLSNYMDENFKDIMENVEKVKYMEMIDYL